MKVHELHEWDVTPARAREIQENLRDQVQLTPLKTDVNVVVGADVSYTRGDSRLFAGGVVMKVPEMEILETRSVSLDVKFPYIPGYLSFREVPPLLQAFRDLRAKPDALICDGAGLAHPRFFGLACHLGMILNIPSFGCAKTYLVGEYKEPANRRWSATKLKHGGRDVGLVVRTREAVKPVYLSPGHLIDAEGSLAVLKKCVGRYRLAEPVRKAHDLVNDERRDFFSRNRS